MNKIPLFVLATGAISLVLAVPTQPASLQAIDQMSKPEQVQKSVRDNHLKTGLIEIEGRTDNPMLIAIDNFSPQISFEDIQINRDFREYLVQTIDRETLERSNQEN
jgi:hypothetical protein